jgi:hypothetical protein
MADDNRHSREIDLSEYEQLRAEINNRTALSAGLVAAQLGAVGGGLSVMKDFPDVVLGLATVSSFLWLLWIDHTSQIYKVAAYISLRLAPRLRAGNPELLGWERFLRALDQEDQAAAKVLFGQATTKNVSLLRTEQIGLFIALLFGLSPILLIIGSILARPNEVFDCGKILSLHSGVLVVAIAAWLFAIDRYRRFVQARRSIDEAVLGVP